jgi:hypothetical protein
MPPPNGNGATRFLAEDLSLPIETPLLFVWFVTTSAGPADAR